MFHQHQHHQHHQHQHHQHQDQHQHHHRHHHHLHHHHDVICYIWPGCPPNTIQHPTTPFASFARAGRAFRWSLLKRPSREVIASSFVVNKAIIFCTCSSLSCLVFSSWPPGTPRTPFFRNMDGHRGYNICERTWENMKVYEIYILDTNRWLLTI